MLELTMVQEGGMFVAVTGGTGFVGQELVSRLVARGDRVRILSRKTKLAFAQSAAVEVCECDLLTVEPDELAPMLDGVDVLYHCAGQLKSVELMQPLHVDGTRRLLQAATGRIAHWVQLSSVGVYGPQLEGLVTEDTLINPSGEYEITKAVSDQLVLDAACAGGFTCSILRPSNVCGPTMTNQSLFSMISMIDRGLFFFIGQEGASANYIHVSNVAEALIRCAVQEKAKGRIYNLSDQCTLEHFVAVICESLGRSKVNARLPLCLADFAGRIFGRLPGFPLTQARIRAMVGRSTYSISRIERELGYSHVISMDDGIRELVSKYKSTRTPS